MSTVSLAPDIAGMADAQARLRQLLGRDIRFFGPQAMLYPSTPPSAFDDEGIPLDPLAASTPVGSGAAVGIEHLIVVGSARANVLFQPLAAMRRDNLEENRLAIRSRLNKDLILDIADRDQLTDAEYFMVGTFARDVNGNILRNADGTEQQFTPDDGEPWKISNVKVDGFGGLQRVICFGQGSL
jgi:hypothetical protein